MASQPQTMILLIEDHKEFQELVTALLEAEGFVVVAAGTSAAALEALDTLRPALILLDSSLPDGDGAQLARAIRARRIGAPIVLMTTDPRSAGLATEIGAVEVLVKPFSTASLLATVRNRLSNAAPIDLNIQTGQMDAIAADMISPTRDLGDAPPSRQPAQGSQPAPNAPVTPPPATTDQWEYCQLIAAGRGEIRGETYYSVDLVFMGSTVTARRIASREGPAAAPWTTNPWKQAIGMLGLAGWEMVNIQHGDYAGRAAENSTLSWNTVVAYFRRPVLPNRPITEPKISLTRT
ncbi:MAG TPA: response regulator transcription factor [Thermomicrobiales bacterium]|nr:response regulator transcription factor [Thermomicrobiales bacterium]